MIEVNTVPAKGATAQQHAVRAWSRCGSSGHRLEQKLFSLVRLLRGAARSVHPLYNLSHSCITTDRGLVKERRVRYPTLVWAEVQHPGLRPRLFS